MAVGWNSGKGGVPKKENVFEMVFKDITIIRDKTRSSWLNCALRDDEAVTQSFTSFYPVSVYSVYRMCSFKFIRLIAFKIVARFGWIGI